MHLTFGPAEAGTDRYTVIGAPYENPSYRGGASRAPTAIREASRGLEPYIHRMDLSLTDMPLADYGDLPTGTHDDIELHLDVDTEFPIFLGGDHSVTPPLIGSFYEDEEPVTVISLDAHLDYRDTFRGDPASNACSARRLSELDAVDSVVVVGARSGSAEEWNSDLPRFRWDEVVQGPERVGTRVAEESDRIHLSIDMDVFDPGYAPGVGNPEPMGLTPDQVRTFIDTIAHRLVGLDVVEVVPGLDAGETAVLAAWLVRETLGVVEVSR